MRGVCWCTLNTSLPQTENVLRAGGSQGLLQHVGVPLAPGHRREDAPPEGPGYPHLQACLLLPQPCSPCGFCQVSLFSSEPRLRYVGRAWCPLIPSSPHLGLFRPWLFSVQSAKPSGMQEAVDIFVCLSQGSFGGCVPRKIPSAIVAFLVSSSTVCPCLLHTSPVESGVSVPSYFCAIVTIAGDAVTEESQ